MKTETFSLTEFDKIDLSKLEYNSWYDCKTSQGLKSWTPDQMLKYGGVTHVYVPISKGNQPVVQSKEGENG